MSTFGRHIEQRLFCSKTESEICATSSAVKPNQQVKPSCYYFKLALAVYMSRLVCQRPQLVWHVMQCLNEDVLQPMVTCIKRLPRIMGAEGLAALWPGKAPSSTDLASIIIGNDAINSCR